MNVVDFCSQMLILLLNGPDYFCCLPQLAFQILCFLFAFSQLALQFLQFCSLALIVSLQAHHGLLDGHALPAFRLKLPLQLGELPLVYVALATHLLEGVFKLFVPSGLFLGLCLCALELSLSLFPARFHIFVVSLHILKLSSNVLVFCHGGSSLALHLLPQPLDLFCRKLVVLLSSDEIFVEL